MFTDYIFASIRLISPLILFSILAALLAIAVFRFLQKWAVILKITRVAAFLFLIAAVLFGISTRQVFVEPCEGLGCIGQGWVFLLSIIIWSIVTFLSMGFVYAQRTLAQNVPFWKNLPALVFIPTGILFIASIVTLYQTFPQISRAIAEEKEQQKSYIELQSKTPFKVLKPNYFSPRLKISSKPGREEYSGGGTVLEYGGSGALATIEIREWPKESKLFRYPSLGECEEMVLQNINGRFCSEKYPVEPRPTAMRMDFEWDLDKTHLYMEMRTVLPPPIPESELKDEFFKVVESINP